MSRSIAFLVSTAIHAAAFLLVGLLLGRNPRHASPGEPGAGMTASTGAGDVLLVEFLSSPEIGSPTVTLVEEPELADIELVAPPLTPPDDTLTADISANATPSSLLPKPIAEKTDTKTAPHGKQAARAARGSRSQGGSPGMAGTGGDRGTPGYEPPQFRFRNKPPYPQEARDRRLEGTVLLLVSLDAGGRVTRVIVKDTSGYDVLDRAALTAVHSWRFSPARQNGEAIATQVEVPLRFRFG